MEKTEYRRWNGNSAILNATSGTKINMSNCTFANNNATWGGGLCIYMRRGSYDNKIAISNSTLVGNIAHWGGGGLHIRLGALSNNSQNYISFDGVAFEANSAQVFGGGTSITALLVSNAPKPGDTIQFINCTWHRNSAQYSAAVDLSPYRFQQSRQGYSPIPLFKDITIQSNYATINGINYNVIVQGVFVVTRFTAHFQGSIYFQDNSYTALYLTSGRAVFANCNVEIEVSKEELSRSVAFQRL